MSAGHSEWDPERDKQRAQEWILTQCAARGVEWDQLSFADQRTLTMAIPCSIRCWRVGISVPSATPGTKCEECGRPVPPHSLFEHIAEGADP